MEFEELKRKVQQREEISSKNKYELITYLAIQNILNRYLLKQIDNKAASRELGTVKRAYMSIVYEQKTHKAMLYQYQENIKNSSEYRCKINQGLKNNSTDRELLDIAIKCIGAMCSDKLLIENWNKRKENDKNA